MSQDPTTGGDSELRKRAAWLLGMLILVAVLVVIVMTTLLKSDKGSGGNGEPVGPDPITSTGPPSTSHGATGHRTPSGSSSSSPGHGTGSGAGSSVPTGGPKTCPTTSPCALTTDVGGGVAAVNAYRAKHGLAAVPGSVSAEAEQCALRRGDGCSGGWAETEIPAPADGTLAVNKISQFAKLLDPMKSIEVGWAYDPGTKTYYFVTIRKD